MAVDFYNSLSPVLIPPLVFRLVVISTCLGELSSQTSHLIAKQARIRTFVFHRDGLNDNFIIPFGNRVFTHPRFNKIKP